MPDPRRIKRLENLILQTVAPLISHGLSDPRLALITVTRIRLSQDLSVARVNWSCIGQAADRSKALHALEHAKGHLTTAVAKAMQTRITPRLEFHFDEGLEKSIRVHAILHDLALERAGREDADAEGTADTEITDAETADPGTPETEDADDLE